MKGVGKWKGELIEFAVWTQESDNAGKYFSGKIQVPRVKDEPAKPRQEPSNGETEIPF